MVNIGQNWGTGMVASNSIIHSHLGQVIIKDLLCLLHAVCIFPWPVSREFYRRRLAVSSTTISYPVSVVIFGGGGEGVSEIQTSLDVSDL